KTAAIPTEGERPVKAYRLPRTAVIVPAQATKLYRPYAQVKEKVTPSPARAACLLKRWSWLLVGLIVAGCGPPAAPPPGRAELVVRRYFEAIVQQDWPTAYAALHPDLRKRWNAEQFTRRAQQYRSHLGFEPDGVQVRACEERAIEAV